MSHDAFMCRTEHLRGCHSAEIFKDVHIRAQVVAADTNTTRRLTAQTHTHTHTFTCELKHSINEY